jgi:hypothetical protein
MPKGVLAAAIYLVLAFGVSAQQSAQPAPHSDGHSWWAHVKFLADDALEGRETGSEGLRKAESYVIDEFSKAGLQAAGSNGFHQHIKFVSRQIVEQHSSASLVRGGKTEPLVLGGDAFFSTRAELSSEEITAPLLFVGYGLQIPEKNYDDLSGLDLHGKIAVYLAGSPADIPAALASHYQTIGERWKFLKRAGAIGSGHAFEELAASGKDRKPLPHFPLKVSLKARAEVKTTAVESANIIGKLPGNDPALKTECLVISAHLDHIGIGEPVNGDRIYNGAMDNASGVAVLLDLAAQFNARSEKLRRSILFLVVTAEEKGLLGSKYFAAHPTVPPKSMIADINIDMFLPIVPLKVLNVPGLAESDLGDRARDAAQLFGVRVQPDPEPLRNVFIRSDQYNFIRHGVPSLKMDVGFDPGSPEQKIFKDWLTNRYHAPSDDLAQPVDLGSAGLYEDIVRQLLISVANTDARPQWKPDSFFRRYATDVGN